MTPLVSAQAADAAELARKGLPYWLAGLLASVIVLLLVFIFLRDRDLRYRINEFLSGAKRRVKRAQLRLKLKRERRRRADALAELGRKSWAARLAGEAYESFHANLALLEKEGRAKQAELQEIMTRAMETRRKQDEIVAAPGGRPGKRADPGVLEEARRLKKSAREGERRIRAGQADLREIEGRKAAQFIALGECVDAARPEAAELLGSYVQVDKHNRLILHYMNELEKFL